MHVCQAPRDRLNIEEPQQLLRVDEEPACRIASEGRLEERLQPGPVRYGRHKPIEEKVRMCLEEEVLECRILHLSARMKMQTIHLCMLDCNEPSTGMRCRPGTKTTQSTLECRSYCKTMTC